MGDDHVEFAILHNQGKLPCLGKGSKNQKPNPPRTPPSGLAKDQTFFFGTFPFSLLFKTEQYHLDIVEKQHDQYKCIDSEIYKVHKFLFFASGLFFESCSQVAHLLLKDFQMR